jgi:hypothetical protein
MIKLKAEKDLAAGLIYILLAGVFFWIGREYRLGTASRMGPGYFPLVLSCVLGGLGAISIVRSFLKHGPRIGAVAWVKLIIITLCTMSFAFLIDRAGLIFALPAMVIISAFASSQSRFDLRGILVLLGLTGFCIMVFVKGLGVPMPIFGAWFDGLVPPAWQR